MCLISKDDFDNMVEGNAELPSTLDAGASQDPDINSTADDAAADEGGDAAADDAAGSGDTALGDFEDVMADGLDFL